MLDSLDNGRDEKDKAVNSQKHLRSDKFNAGSCIQDEESCQKGDMCPRNGGSLQGINLKLGKSYLKMIPDEKVESDLLVNVKSTERTNCLDGECCTESPQTARMTGSSCRALKHAVSTLNRLDDFNMEKIGSGFFSEVFKVTHKVTGKVMVLKMNLLRSNRPNMLKEVQLMNQLKHQNILKFKGVCVHEGQLHALSEYINGGSLEQLIQARNIDLPYVTRQKLALDIARGMEYLHGKGVFHRDLTSKNVLIKKSDDGSMTAVVGDFGLAAKIPDPKCKYRLPTVGSAYWMSPECLKGHWYNEKSDIFSYGIVLCEMIARIEADPDILPRTDNFGLDYLVFSELCGPCPPHFLKLAFSCCTFEPKSRPSFSEIVKTLERLIPEYEELLREEAEEEVKMVNAGSLNNLIDVTDKSNMLARSEEVINKCASSGRDMMQQRKLHHRRSLSEDVANVVFPKHTAPSDKARCHFMTTSKQQSCEVLANPKHIGESMCQVDPHYKPRLSGEKGGRSNPFLSLVQFRGVKKIVGSQNILLSKDSHNSIESPTSFLQNNDLFSSCFELPSPFYGITPPSSPVSGNSFDENTKKNSCCGCYQEGCDFKDDCGKSCRIDELEGECKKFTPRRLFQLETSPETNKNKQYFDISSSSPKSNVCCHHQKISCANDHSKSLLLSSSSSSSSSQSPNLFLRSVNKKSVLNRSEFPHRHQNFPPNRNLSMSLPSSPTLQRKASRESTIFAQKETEKQLVIPSDDESNEIPKKLIKSKTVPLIKKNADFPGANKSGSKTNKDLKKTDRDQHEDESSSSSSKNLPDNLIFQENLPNTKDVRKKNDKRTTNETDLNTLVTNRISTSSSNLLDCSADDGFLMASNLQLKRRGSCESGFFSCLGEDYGITGNEILPCEYVLQSTRQKHLDNSSATLSSSSATSSLFLLDDSLSTTTVSSLRSGSGDFNDLDDLPSRFAHHSILFSTKRPSSIYTDSSEDISSLGELDERNHSRYQSQQISKIVEYFERKQTGVTRNETYTKYKRNFNIEFQKNIERFDTSRGDDNNKIKWEGLEGKFKKSGMGLTQKQYNNCDYGPKSKVLYDVNNFKLKKFGPQNAAESSYHHDLSKKFEGSCSISDAIRKSKIELLRKSLERGTLQVPGINPHLSSNSGVSETPNERNSIRPLATRLMICEGAVKSKLPLFDKK